MNGIINLLKPGDMSSQQAVSALKRMLGVKKAGHGGTLDPAAAGVLPIFLGQATRVAQFVSNDDKEYIAQVRFGISTDTQDAQGRAIFTSDAVVDEDAMRALLNALPRELTQIPPAYSAIKVGGRKSVDLARKGIAREIPARRVHIDEKQFLGTVGPNAYLIRIRCSKGTYIRTLCHDFGEAVGAGAHCSFLLRTKSGPYAIEDAVTFEDIARAVEGGAMQALLLPADSALSALPKVRLDAQDVRRARQGQAVSAPIECEQGQTLALYDDSGALIAIGGYDQGNIRPRRVFNLDQGE
jgi:tRNA pseudouridine55 synthase